MSSSDTPSDDRPDELTGGSSAGPPAPPLVPKARPGDEVGAEPADGPGPPVGALPGPPSGAVPGRPGTGTFTIEGRAAPALFVIGWLASLFGFGLLIVAILAGGGVSATILLLVALVILSIGLIAAAGSQGIERRTRATRPYRGPSPLLVFAASIPVSVLAVIVLAIPLRLLDIDLDGPLAALISVGVQAILYVGLVRLLVVDTGALTWLEMGVQRLDPAAFRQMAAGAVWALPVIFLTGIVAQILLSVFPVTPSSPLPPTGTAIGFALSLIAGVIVAPFGEEIMFRAFATTAWVRGMNTTNGLVLGSLFFAFAHVLTVTGTSAGDAFQLAFVAFAGRLPVAFTLGWLFLRRRSMWASFGLHATFNGVLLVIAEVASRSIG